MTTKRIKKKLAKREAIKLQKYFEAAKVAILESIAEEYNQLPKQFVTEAFNAELFGSYVGDGKPCQNH